MHVWTRWRKWIDSWPLCMVFVYFGVWFGLGIALAARIDPDVWGPVGIWDAAFSGLLFAIPTTAFVWWDRRRRKRRL